MLSWKRLSQVRWFQEAVGSFATGYLRLVAKTGRWMIEPADIYQRIESDLPIILAVWHGQHYLVPFLRRPEHRVKVLVSRHRDGEVNAIVTERLGAGTIRGSGDHGPEFGRKGGVSAFRAMLDALNEGYTMVLTADVPKVSRVAGLGIVKLAQHSGRPIYPVAVATSRRIKLDTWDRSVINLPFGRTVAIAGEPIRVPANADAAKLEQARRSVEERLNAATTRAYALADRRGDVSP